MTTHWRPQVLWIPMGGLLGALAGAATGGVLMLVATVLEADITLSSEGTAGAVAGAIVAAIMIGMFFGGIAGFAVGLVVGVEMTFLVGSHLPREVARPRARLLGSVLPPLTMVVAALGATVLDGTRPSLSVTGVLWWAVALGGASVLGGPLARWLAGFQPPRTPVS